MDITPFSIVTRGKDDCWGNAYWITVARFASSYDAKSFIRSHSKGMNRTYHIRLTDEDEPTGFRTLSSWFNGQEL